MHYPIKTIDIVNKTTIYNTGVDKSKDIPNHQILIMRKDKK